MNKMITKENTPIKLQYRLDLELYKKAYYLHMKHRKLFRWIPYYFYFLGVFSFPILTAPKAVFELNQYIFPALFFALGLFFKPLIWKATKRSIQKYAGIDKNISIQINDIEISSEIENFAKGSVYWSGVIHAVFGKNISLLYIGPSHFHILPHKAIESKEDLNLLHRQIEKKVKKILKS